LKKNATIIILALICIILVTCTVSPFFIPTPDLEPTQVEDPSSESSPIEEHSSNQFQEPGDLAIDSTMDELVAFILKAEQVYRDIVLGELFNSHMDPDSGEWILSEYVEEAPDYRIDTPEGPYQSMSMFRHRVLPSSGFTSIAELNEVVHEFWSESFKVSSESIASESIDYAEIDGALYFFPAGASGIGDIFLGVVWELAVFELINQEGNHATVRAEAYLTSYGNLYQCTIQWEIEGSKIVTRDIDFGEHILWRDMPDAIDAMVASGRWTQEYVEHNWESGWFDEQEAW